MTEILTESFCERCGTRYTFESSAPRQKRLGGLKVLGRGFKNFVMADDSSLDEAFAAARSDAEREATAHQLDAFHKTFNFCMSCRQYTCANCWNEPEARCLSCAPLAVDESAPIFEEEIDPERLLRFMGGPAADAPATTGEPAAADHVHASELIGDEIHEAHLRAEAHEAEVAAEVAAAAEQAGAEQAAAAVAEEAPAAMAIAAEPELDSRPELGSEPEVDLAHQVDIVPQAEAAAEPPVEPRAGLAISGFEPGQSLDDAIAAYEASLTSEAFAAAGEPAAVAEVLGEQAEPEPEAAVEAAVEPIAEHVAAAPETTAEPEPAAAPAPEPEPVVAIDVAPDEAPSKPAGVDVIDQPVWPAAAGPVADAPVSPPASPSGPAEPPSWPTGPRWPTAIPARQAPPAAVPAVDPLTALMARSSTDAMWAASNRDVLQPIAAAQTTAAVQPCVNCGISLSATARFCRRCGTPQG